MPRALLEDRSILAVTGEDAEDLLQGLITTDLSLVKTGESWPGALLTPQGKILFEFLVSRTDEGLLLEISAESTDAFAKRLTLYKLRAKASIARQDGSVVTAIWDEDAPAGALRDMRFAKAGIELFRTAGADGTDTRQAYDALRFRHGISGGGEDGQLGDYFPHDLLMDRNGGLSFKKGCYVGQEVVSRMQHRSTARRRLVSISGSLPEPGTPVLAGDREIGTVIASSGEAGLAVVRIDKAGAALAAGTPVTAGGHTVQPTLPGWTGLEFPADADEAAS